jgi:hypothetical protein
MADQDGTEIDRVHQLPQFVVAFDGVGEHQDGLGVNLTGEGRRMFYQVARNRFAWEKAARSTDDGLGSPS